MIEDFIKNVQVEDLTPAKEVECNSTSEEVKGSVYETRLAELKKVLNADMPDTKSAIQFIGAVQGDKLIAICLAVAEALPIEALRALGETMTTKSKVEAAETVPHLLALLAAGFAKIDDTLNPATAAWMVVSFLLKELEVIDSTLQHLIGTLSENTFRETLLRLKEATYA